VSPPLVAALADAGIDEPFPVQVATIPPALAGLDVAGQAPTGSGKTLAFGLPLLERTGGAVPRTPGGLVLAPTRELAAQICLVLAPLGDACGVRVVPCYGGMPFEPQIEALTAGVDVVVATPGRLLDLVEQGLVTLASVHLAVVDEADRLADMGFLPQTVQLLEMTRADRQTLLFSATLDGDVDVLVREHQRDPVRHEVAPEASGPVRHLVWEVADADKADLLARIVRRAGPTMVFTRTRHGADRVARRLAKAQVRTAVLHGGNTQLQRHTALEEFREGTARALVATDVVARGVHVQGVACVVQHDLPVDDKDHVHRAGRTGRAGAAGTIVTFAPPGRLDEVVAVLTELGLDVEPGEPDATQIERWATREAIDAQLAELDAIRRPGHLGAVAFDYPNPDPRVRS
jgi:superfamily II DNA/RNA helicase